MDHIIRYCRAADTLYITEGHVIHHNSIKVKLAGYLVTPDLTSVVLSYQIVNFLMELSGGTICAGVFCGSRVLGQPITRHCSREFPKREFSGSMEEEKGTRILGSQAIDEDKTREYHYH